MLKIGEFSRLSQVTVKTLHHYDDIGLLKPSDVDSDTGYRYYSLDQLPHIHRIMALKELGLSLEQIALMLNQGVSQEQLQGMLQLKRAELRQQLAEEQARLAQVEFRLRQIALERLPTELDIVVKQIQPVRTLTIRDTYPSYEAMESIRAEILAALARSAITLAGSPVGIYYGDEFRTENIDHECAAPVDESRQTDLLLETCGVMKLRDLSALDLAATHIHQGSYDTLKEKFTVFQRWVVLNGYRLGGETRFIFYRGPMNHNDPDTYLTEIQHQIERV